MNCIISVLKFIVFVINVLAAIFGIATIVICSFAIGILDDEHLSFCIFGIVTGLIVSIVAFFGICGAHRKSSSYMWTYVALLSIMLVLQLTSIFIYHSKDFGNMVTEELELLWAKDLESPGSMAPVEDHFKCCGLYSSNDYTALNRTIPSSCYDKDKPKGSNLYVDGCRNILAHIYEHIGKTIRVTNWILCSTEATSLIFACILTRSFRVPNHMRYITN